MAPILSRLLSNIGGGAVGGTRRRVSGVAPAPIVATGGTKTTSGLYTIHTFTSSQDFVVTSGSNTIEYLIIAGGGGGGGYSGGIFYAGGGAGGYRTNVPGQTSGGNSPAEPVSSFISPGTYAIVVGGGGAVGTDGNPSHFGPGTPFPISSTGGGRGGGIQSTPSVAGPGGSGGGGNLSPSTGGTGTPGQGFPGGNTVGYTASPYSGDPTLNLAGGGGSGGAGGNSGPTISGVGGAGLDSNITGSVIRRASGGTGGTYNQTLGSQTPGGGGGGGRYSPSVTAGNGTANTGGGGGGGPSSGGSGLVIIRYLT